jgi:putative glutamine amidotransferase
MAAGTRVPGPQSDYSARMDNARRPLIGVTGHRLETGTEVKTLNVTCKESYLHAVRLGGGIPVVLAPTDNPDAIAEMLERLDGVLLTGGRDVDPSHFGEATFNDTVHVEPHRDAFELPLSRQAVERDLPTLAICRGAQVLNVALGGSLWQDLPTQRPSEIAHQQAAPRDALTHDVRVDRDSLLGDLLQEWAREPIRTNTFHHQAAKDVPDPLQAVARAADDTIEAIEAPNRRFVLGVQWHPEELTAYPAHLRLFEAFIRAARFK